MDVILISSNLYGKSSIKMNIKLLIYKKLCVFLTPENSIYYSTNTYKHKKKELDKNLSSSFNMDFKNYSAVMVPTPASSWSTNIRPQYSHTITFLRKRISNWRCAGILLKHPPQASRCT